MRGWAGLATRPAVVAEEDILISVATPSNVANSTYGKDVKHSMELRLVDLNAKTAALRCLSGNAAWHRFEPHDDKAADPLPRRASHRPRQRA
jgi:hypothetical protein